MQNHCCTSCMLHCSAINATRKLANGSCTGTIYKYRTK